MANPWFKFYGGEYLGDQKIFSLSTAERSCWITLLCCASQSNGVVKYLTEEQLMLQAGVNFQEDEWDRTKGVLELFKKLGMLSIRNGIITVKNWKKRQETMLSNAERQAKFRERNGKVTERVTKVTLDKIRIDEEEIREERGDFASLTPSQEARTFFEGKNQQIIDEFIAKSNAPPEAFKNEVTKFVLYWTERNKSGTKQRWETEKTFEVRRRLAQWLSRVKDFQKVEFSRGRGVA